ncbi:TetR/AcrR family transcriptional regulator [Psychromicrobium sp. YIM B11713]|uniref:TetR/AcrR family transcriptional regulator n=1 Tax=Psychromicrobium sp. YIM B11713 TaxID=3145233 RepID=UPI00374F8177
MTQRTVQDRAKAKYLRILDAALVILRAEGPSGITLRAVAQKAEVPASSVSYYFPNLVELIQGAFAHYLRALAPAMSQAVRKQLAESTDLRRVAGPLAEQVTSRDGAALLPLLETYLVVARDPELYPEARRLLDQLPQAVQAFLESLGIAKSKELADSVIGLIEGYALRRVLAQGAAGSDNDSLRLAFEHLFEGFLAMEGKTG